MTNLDTLISKTEHSHKEISARTGRKGNWYNDAFNNNEDIRVSSLARILSAIKMDIDIKEVKLSALFDDKVLSIARVISNIKDEEEDSPQIREFISAENELFLDLFGDWGPLEAKGKLSAEEKSTFQKIKELIKQQGGQI